MKKELSQNDVTAMRELGVDLAPRWEEILGDLIAETNFQPIWEAVRQSEWWRTGKVGAVSIDGLFGSQDAVLKIQGTRPNTSEVDMVKAFSDQNKSDIIRASRIYFYREWNDESQYEAAIYEKVNGKPVIEKHPANDDELDNYWQLYVEYKQNCITQPWITKPEDWSYSEQVERWLKATENLRAKDPYIKESDWELMKRAIEIIEKNLKVSDLEFMHGHFQPGDLIVVSEEEVVICSNLFWSWRIPHYDKVFGYHWWLLGMEHVSDFKESKYVKERDRWLKKIYSLPDVSNEHLLKLAFLERAVPALMVDRLMMGVNDEVTRLITEYKRQELRELINELQ